MHITIYEDKNITSYVSIDKMYKKMKNYYQPPSTNPNEMTKNDYMLKQCC